MLSPVSSRFPDRIGNNYHLPNHQFSPANIRIPFFDAHHVTCKSEEERAYFHCAANAQKIAPTSPSRPHVQIITEDNVPLSALVDCGAEICMGRSSLLTKTKSLKKIGAPIPILDCHGNHETTVGEFRLNFGLLQNDSVVNEASANLHLTNRCSSEVILGMDFLSEYGAVICARTGRVQFFPDDQKKVAASLKPILAAGVAAAAAERYIARNDQGDSSFTVSPVDDVDIPFNDRRTVKVKIDTDEGRAFLPGEKVLVTSGISPAPVTLDGLYDVENQNRLSIFLANSSPFDINLMKGRPVPGVVVESMAAYGGDRNRVLTDKDNLIMMSNFDETISQARAIEKVAAAERGIALPPFVDPRYDARDETELRAKMNAAYYPAVAALEASGKPIPGRRTPPGIPPPKEVADLLMSQFSTKDVDPAYLQSYRDLILRNYDIFSVHKLDVGHCSHYQHRIVTLPGRGPQFQKQFKIPNCDEKLLGDFADTMTANNILIPTIQNSHNSAIFTVKKPSGVGRRVVQDFRGVNRCSEEDKWTISDVRQSLIKAGRNKPSIFSKIDATGAYYHLSLAPESQPLTTFTLPFRQQSYMWARCAQGLQGASASFSKLMSVIFKGIPNTLTYVDDLICMCRSHEEMLETLQSVFNECRLHNMKLSLDKTILGVLSIEWIGFNLCAAGISPAKPKLDVIEQMKPPETVNTIKSQLGFLQFISGNIEKFAWIADPLTKLTSQNSGWISTKRSGPLPEPAMRAWKELIRIALSGPVLAFPDHSKPFQLFVDACVGTSQERGGISGVLCQTIDDRTRPVGFFSRKMRASENFYNPYNSELLAIVRSLDHFKDIIKGTDITVFSDHKPLVLDDQKVNKTMSNLSMKIQDFEAKLRFVKGSENIHADFLSRNAASDDLRPMARAATLESELTNLHISQWNDKKESKVSRCRSTVAAAASLPWTDVLFPWEQQAMINFRHKRVGSMQRFSASVASVTRESWAKAQREDQMCQAVIQFLTTKTASRSPKFHSILRVFAPKAFIGDDGLLYLLDGKPGQMFSRRIWVPKAMRQLVLADAHGSQSSGHFAREMVVQKLLQQYWWPTIALDVDEFVSSCPECYVQDDRHARKTRSPMSPYPIPSYRNQYLFCDLVGPLKSATPNKYVLDMTDAYTRWCTLVPIRDKSAQTVAEAIFEKYVMVFGAIANICSDNGLEFANQVADELFRLIETKSHKGCAYHPHAQGLVERNHRTINEYLRIFVNESTTDWEEFLPPLQFALNTRTHSTTKMSPYWMTFGQHPLIPWTAPDARKKTFSESDIANKFRLLMFAHDIVNKNNIEAKKASKRQYDKLAKERTFRVGDQVLVHYRVGPPGTNQKLGTTWRGIFTVEKVLGHNAYTLRKPSGRKTKVHADRMKFFDPIGSREEPEVKLQRDDDDDVADQDEVIEPAQDLEEAQEPRQAVATASVRGAQARPSVEVGIPLSNEAWQQAMSPGWPEYALM